MSADRELLELAAKAAGMVVRWHEDGHYGPTMEIMESEAGGAPWNPLTDDGDALRLAVKLHLNVAFEEFDGAEYVFVVPNRQYQGLDEVMGDDAGAATRRAIVRAAAEIGKSIKTSPLTTF